MPHGIHYLPISVTLFYLLGGIVVMVAVLLGAGILQYAYQSIGISPRYMVSLLALSLFGSFVNIPIAQLPDQEVITKTVVDLWGIHYVVPKVVDWPGTIIAVNLGGAVIPVAISAYLLLKDHFFGEALIGIGIVALVTHLLAVPVPGVGIAVPFFVPPFVAAIAAFVLSRRQTAALAFVSGSLGTLIGADLLNLDQIKTLGAPLASIGGAGTFDGIFLSAVLAVLLAGLLGRFRRRMPGAQGSSS